MGDVVLKLPVRSEAEADVFGRYLNRFMEDRTVEAEAMADDSDAPFLMVRAEPAEACMTVIFQQSSVASDFSSGWARARRSAGRS